jgi:E3 ubiquitin-protein ligase NEDD4
MIFIVSENSIEGVLDQTFSVEEERFGEILNIELIPGGFNIPVTDENKLEYVNAIAQWRIEGRVAKQKDAFLEGFHEMIPSSLISVFDEKELELLFGGVSEIDVDDWQKNTEYRNYKDTDWTIILFWRVRIILIDKLGDSLLGKREKGPLDTIRYRHISYSGKWIQRFAWE